MPVYTMVRFTFADMSLWSIEMDNEILVKEFRQMVKVFQQENGPVSLFMLKAFDAEIPRWNIIISTPVYDDLSLKTALTHLITALNNHLSKSILKQIIRSTVLETTDPFVKEINQAFNVKNAVKYVYSSVISGIELEKAIIFESHPIKRA